LAVPDDYAIVFLQGGGSMQFTMAPMNLCLPGKPVDVLHTGMWTTKAIGELKKGVLHNIAASSEADKFARLPRQNEMKFSSDASYVHICTNNTIEGTQWKTLPETGNAPIVADMSSDIASRPVEVKKYGLIFAGAQKNLGPSGATIVIVRKDLAERADKISLPFCSTARTSRKNPCITRRRHSRFTLSAWFWNGLNPKAASPPSPSAMTPRPSCFTTPSKATDFIPARWNANRVQK